MRNDLIKLSARSCHRRVRTWAKQKDCLSERGRCRDSGNIVSHREKEREIKRER